MDARAGGHPGNVQGFPIAPTRGRLRESAQSPEPLSQITLGRTQGAVTLAWGREYIEAMSSLRAMHVVGSDQGGGFEWTKYSSSVKRGVVALDLNSAGQIVRLDTTWDNSIMSDADLQALVLQSIEK